MDPLAWAGDIELSNGRSATGVQLVATRAVDPILQHASLHFLACVDIARIPLYLAIARPFDVYADNDATEDWFSALLLSAGHAAAKDSDLPWWQHASTAQSPIGILVEVRGSAPTTSSPPLTELLFYATSSTPAAQHGTTPPTTSSSSPPPPSSSLVLRALPLSSALLQNHNPSTTATPPTSPGRHDHDRDHDDRTALPEGEFRPLFWHPPPPPSLSTTTNDRKRASVSSLFDAATERRKRARRHGGESIAAAAAGSGVGGGSGGGAPGPSSASSGRRSVSSSFSVSVSSAGDGGGRPLSRSPSVSVGVSVGGMSAGVGKRTSSLGRVVVGVGDVDGGGSSGQQGVEARNKDVISRLVMAGMRMYGLQQQRKKGVAVRKASVASSSDVAAAAAGLGDGAGVDGGDAAMDEEYKLVYHQAYRGTVFAMRNHIATEPLTLYMDQLRETVDKLLAIFCTDPLAASVDQSSSSVMATSVPQQQPFGTPTGGTETSPFGQRTEYFEGAKREAGARRVHTPGTRRQAG